MTFKIAIGTASFALSNDAPLRLLKQNGAELFPNPFGRRPTEKELMEYLPGMDGLIAGLEPLTEDVLTHAASTLKAVARVGIGLDSVDLQAAERLGIRVSNTPEAPSFAVAENTLAALLGIFRTLVETNACMHGREWKKAMGRSLKGACILLIGYGRIGRIVSRLLQPFTCRILIVDPQITKADLQFENESLTTLSDALPQADVISFHCTGGQTLLSKTEFDRMKQGVTILNPSRYELMDENELIRSIREGKVWRAWIDVFETEPYAGPLCDYEEVLLSPHNATFTQECRRDMEMQAAENLLKDLRAVQGTFE